MKTRVILCIILTTLSLSWSGCSTEDHLAPILESKKLNLSYNILGADQILTYAIPQEPHETKIDNMYTLFFRGTTHALAGQFVGYTRTGSTSGVSGNAKVTMPVGEDVNDAWQLIFIANLEQYLDLNGEPDVATWFTNKLPAGTTIAAAQSELIGLANKRTGIKSSLLMSGELLGAQQKPANTNIASVPLSRQVARIDVSNSDANFTFETVQLWNARTQTYMSGTANMTGIQGGAFENYDQNIINASAQGLVTADLYAFANFVAVPSITDHQTTCLIIGGRLSAAGGGSGNKTYYRVNVSAPLNNQTLKKNGAYTININKVKSDGDTDPGDAYDKSQLKVDYKINEWDDSFNGMYIFDKDGNGLAVSQREVTFSDVGNQEVEIEVFTIASATNPIGGTWAIGSKLGADASNFSAALGSATTFKIKVITENATTADRTAIQNITWGTITLPVKLKQLNPTSQLDGIKVTPNDIWFPIIPGPTGAKEFCVNLQGNYTGITRADILTTILYDRGVTNWLTVGSGTTPDNPALGLYYFKVTASDLSAGNPSRDAFIKLAVKQGVKISTAQVSIRQTQVDIGGGFVRLMNVVMFEKSGAAYVNRGLIEDRYLQFKGLPAGQSGPRHLHFAIIEHLQFKYEMRITSSMGWKIKATGNASIGLNFSKLSDPGDLNNEVIVTITAKNDVASGWDGSYYLEYDNGDREDYIVHQQGVLSTLLNHTTYNGTAYVTVPDGNIYYYGTFRMNNKLWLDRNLGATSGAFFSNVATGPPNDLSGKGLYLNFAQANISCPAGFKLPNSSADEMGYVFANAIWSTSSGNISTGGIAQPYVHYISISSSPLLRFKIPTCGSAPAPTQNYGFYWCGPLNNAMQSIIFYSLNGIVRWNIPEPSHGISTRCVAI